jgi:hypothetical protein
MTIKKYLMDQMYKSNLNLDQTQNFSHGLPNQSQHLLIHLLTLTQILMMEVCTIRKKFQLTSQMQVMIYL